MMVETDCLNCHVEMMMEKRILDTTLTVCCDQCLKIADQFNDYMGDNSGENFTD